MLLQRGVVLSGTCSKIANKMVIATSQQLRLRCRVLCPQRAALACPCASSVPWLLTFYNLVWCGRTSTLQVAGSKIPNAQVLIMSWIRSRSAHLP